MIDHYTIAEQIILNGHGHYSSDTALLARCLLAVADSLREIKLDDAPTPEGVPADTLVTVTRPDPDGELRSEVVALVRKAIGINPGRKLASELIALVREHTAQDQQ